MKLNRRKLRKFILKALNEGGFRHVGPDGKDFVAPKATHRVIKGNADTSSFGRNADYAGKPWAIEVDTRQAYGQEAADGNYFYGSRGNESAQVLIRHSLENGGQIARFNPRTGRPEITAVPYDAGLPGSNFSGF